MDQGIPPFTLYYRVRPIGAQFLIVYIKSIVIVKRIVLSLILALFRRRVKFKPQALEGNNLLFGDMDREERVGTGREFVHEEALDLGRDRDVVEDAQLYVLGVLFSLI
jgi:hypothetical protein